MATVFRCVIYEERVRFHILKYSHQSSELITTHATGAAADTILSTNFNFQPEICKWQHSLGISRWRLYMHFNRCMNMRFVIANKLIISIDACKFVPKSIEKYIIFVWRTHSPTRCCHWLLFPLHLPLSIYRTCANCEFFRCIIISGALTICDWLLAQIAWSHFFRSLLLLVWWFEFPIMAPIFKLHASNFVFQVKSGGGTKCAYRDSF